MIVEQFERIASRQRDHVAVTSAAGELTYGELRDRALGLAVRLAARTCPGDLIAIQLPACPSFPVAMLACLAAGRPFVVFNPDDPREWLDHAAREARPALILREGDSLLEEAPRAGWRPAVLGPDEPACVLFTSGSTGRPKGIVNSQRNLLQRVTQSIEMVHIDSRDRLLTLAAPSSIAGVRDVITALVAGARMHLVDPRSVGARDVRQLLSTEAITILFAFPALLRTIVPGRGDRAPASLRLVRVGGDTTLWSDIDALRAWLPPDADVQVIYAATEAPMMQWIVDDACRGDDPRIPIGRPLPGNPLTIVDGELVVESPYVSLGQWTDGRLSVDHVEAGRAPGTRIFRTGDLVRERPDGLLERVGRTNRQVKIRGSRVDLDGVEAWLRGHPSVTDVAVVARAGADETVTLSAYVSAPGDEQDGVIDALTRSMRSAPPGMRPARFTLVPSIPRLANSKLDVRALAALDDAHARRERPAPAPAMAGDPMTRVVARAWRETLGVPVSGGADDFFEAGGDSLKAITFVLALEQALGTELSIALINEAPRFDQLCQALRERRAPGSSLAVTLKEGDGRPPVFFVPGLGGSPVSLLAVSRLVTYPGPVIGIRARGLVRGETPHSSIEAMAGDALAAIRQRQAAGPYYLCGYSSGGLVVFDIARRLRESGDQVAFVGLVDTRMSIVRWPARAWLSAICSLPGKLRPSLDRIRVWRGAVGMLRVAIRTLVASARYRPASYAGTLTLFTPAGHDPHMPSLESLWRPHAESVIVIETGGTHATMLSGAHAETTASALSRCVVTDEGDRLHTPRIA